MNCVLCGNPCTDSQDLFCGHMHAACDEMFTERESTGKCADCGGEKRVLALQCDRCMEFGSRIEARRAGGYAKL